MADPGSMAGDSAPTTASIVARTSKFCQNLKIEGYEALKGVATGGCHRSKVFSVGGYNWYVAYFPNGETQESADYMSVFLFRQPGPPFLPVMARFLLNLLDQNGQPVRAYTKSTGFVGFLAPGAGQGFPLFVRRSYLERSKHLKDDAFSIGYEVAVITQVRAEDSATPSFLPPPRRSPGQFLDLLTSGQRCDVTFLVDGVAFHAHRLILGARSPVLRAGLWGSTGDGSASSTIKVDDMRPDVFHLLLGFLYSEMLPALEEEGRVPMLQHLLVAADRYSVPELVTICEIQLAQNLKIDTVASTLALAEQRGCQMLKDRCLHFMEAPGIYQAVINTDDFDHLATNFTPLLREILSRRGPR